MYDLHYVFFVVSEERFCNAPTSLFNISEVSKFMSKTLLFEADLQLCGFNCSKILFSEKLALSIYAKFRLMLGDRVCDLLFIVHLVVFYRFSPPLQIFLPDILKRKRLVLSMLCLERYPVFCLVLNVSAHVQKKMLLRYRYRSSHPRCSRKKLFLKILQQTHEKTRIHFLKKLQA